MREKSRRHTLFSSCEICKSLNKKEKKSKENPSVINYKNKVKDEQVGGNICNPCDQGLFWLVYKQHLQISKKGI